MSKKKKKIYGIIILVLLFICTIYNIYYFFTSERKPKVEYKENDLPKLDIKGKILKLEDKKEKLKVKVEYKSNDLNFETYATIKLQGQYSLRYPKKNYNIVFYEDRKLEYKKNIDFKWGDYSKYTLKAEWVDGSNTRNVFASRIAAKMNEKYGLFTNTKHFGLTDGYPIELFIKGKYHGLYTINLNKDYLFDEPNGREYLLISNQTDYGMRNIKQETPEWKNFEVEVGEENKDTLNKFNRLLYFIHTSTDDEFKNNIDEYFNIDSLLNYYCYIKFAGLWDNAGKNLFFLTYDGKVWYTVIYDLDQSYGGPKQYDQSIKILNDFINEFSLWTKLENNFGPELANRWFELREEIFTKENVIKEFENYYSHIPNAAFENEKSMWPAKVSYSTNELNNFLTLNIPTQDEHFNSLKTR